MTNNPDEIRAEIEVTRTELGTDVDALADKVTPSKIAHRQVGRMRSAFTQARDRVMGGTSELGDRGADAMADAAQTVRAKAEGNPLAVGLIAFGIGWLAASLIPASQKEKELASSVKDAAAPLVDEAKDAAKDVADSLQEPARHAANEVKQAAADAADDVKARAGSAAHDVTEHAQNAADEVRRP
jgi:hypothetical protein